MRLPPPRPPHHPPSPRRSQRCRPACPASSAWARSAMRGRGGGHASRRAPPRTLRRRPPTRPPPHQALEMLLGAANHGCRLRALRGGLPTASAGRHPWAGSSARLWVRRERGRGGGWPRRECHPAACARHKGVAPPPPPSSHAARAAPSRHATPAAAPRGRHSSVGGRRAAHRCGARGRAGGERVRRRGRQPASSAATCNWLHAHRAAAAATVATTAATHKLRRSCGLAAACCVLRSVSLSSPQRRAKTQAPDCRHVLFSSPHPFLRAPGGRPAPPARARPRHLLRNARAAAHALPTPSRQSIGPPCRSSARVGVRAAPCRRSSGPRQSVLEANQCQAPPSPALCPPPPQAWPETRLWSG